MVETGLLKFSWVIREAIKQTRLLQSCWSCPGHFLEAQELMADGLGESEDGPERSRGQLQDFVYNCNQRPETPESTYGEGKLHEPQPSILADVTFDPTFDDYASSPLDSQGSQNNQLGTYSFDIDGAPLVSSEWFRWRDRGLRLPYKDFFQLIRTAEPTRSLDSLLTFTNILPHKMEPYGLSEFNSYNFSAAELLDEAGNTPGSLQSKRVLLTGQEQKLNGEDASPLILNLEKDGIHMPIQDVKISIDLDSLIWVTTLSGFQMTLVYVHLSPSLSLRAPITNNNHVYVRLLQPPRNEHERLNPDTRECHPVPLSQIPHVEFGFCGSGETRVNILILFPRMVHKPQKARRYATLLPQSVQDLWYDEVIIPSCKAVIKDNSGLTEYLPSSLHDMRKQLNYKQKSVFILNPRKLMREIQSRIHKGGDLLSCFGSPFLVADSRGMKFATKQCLYQGSNGATQPAIELIKGSFPQLDWERMLDRKHGELYLDIGISYHSDHRHPLTGLWRIPSLQKSFEALGCQSPTVHHMGTLGFYGGLKAEMKAKSKQNSHIISRIAYCLAFETIRSPGTQEYLCSNKDIIDRTPKFLNSVRNWSELFLSAQSRSYGVRDELRGLGSVILDFLPNSVEKVLPIFLINMCKRLKNKYRRGRFYLTSQFSGSVHQPSFA
jgi:hypothetical protein